MGGQEQRKRGSKPARSAGRCGGASSSMISGRPDSDSSFLCGVSPHLVRKTRIAALCYVSRVWVCFALLRFLRQRAASCLIAVGGINCSLCPRDWQASARASAMFLRRHPKKKFYSPDSKPVAKDRRNAGLCGVDETVPIWQNSRPGDRSAPTFRKHGRRAGSRREHHVRFSRKY